MSADDYIYFDEVAPTQVRKTRIVNVINRRSKSVLGQIKWYGVWRQYCFTPTASLYVVFNDDCLRRIADECSTMTEAHRGAGDRAAAMSIRNVAVAALARARHDWLSFNSIEDVARLGPPGEQEVVPMDEYYRRFDRPFVALVDAVDWHRALIEATRRHTALCHEDEGQDYLGDSLCGECIAEALLAPNWIDWTEEPKAPRERRPIVDV